MSQPTQPLPPWYTASVTTLTDPAGAVTTSTTLLFLPLTYYGPSIPLDSAAWTYGGLTSPASTSTPASTETIPTSTSSASSSAASSGSPITSSASASSSSSTSALSVTPTPSISSSTSLSIPTPTASTGISHRNRNIAIIVGVVCGTVLLLFLCLFCLYCRARRRRRAAGGGSGSILPRRSPTPLEEDYFVVDHEAGEGSPRHSGEEADPFLRAHSQPQMRETRPAAPAMGVRDSTASSNQRTVHTSSSGSNSGYGTEIVRTLQRFPFALSTPAQVADEHGKRKGKILSTQQLMNISADSLPLPEQTPHPRRTMFPPGSPPPDSDFFPQDSQYQPLLPPPRLVDPAQPVTSPLNGSRNSSSGSFDNDEATLLTAQRVRVGSRAERAPQIVAAPSSSEGAPSSWLGLGRFSWFKNLESSSSLHNTHSEHATTSDSAHGPVTGYFQQERPVSGALVEPTGSRPVSGSFIFSIISPGETRPRPISEAAGDRPISTASANSRGSGTTVYHDAREEQFNSGSGKGSNGGTGSGKGSERNTPLEGSQVGEWGSLSTPMPAAAVASSSGEGRSSPAVRHQPRSYEATPLTQQPNTGDLLDSPIPSAFTSFHSRSTPPLALQPSVASLATAPFMPPGLAPPRLISHAGGGLDILEEEPPARAADLWKDPQSRRQTFGIGLGMPSFFASPSAPSLTSMRSHEFYPSPAGSASTPHIRTLSPTHLPPSRRMYNDGSLSSQSAASMSLNHSSSISSDSRKRRREQQSSNSSEAMPRSPALSAFGAPVGPQQYLATVGEASTSSTLMGARHLPSFTETVSDGTTRVGGSSSIALTNKDSDAPLATSGTSSTDATVALEDFPDVPWALGLGKEWDAS